MNAKRRNRIQNLSILLLAFSAVMLLANLPLFGALSDQSLLELARNRLRRESAVSEAEVSGAASLVFPVRMVYTNNFARLGSDALTTLSDEFELAGTYLSEAAGSAYDKQSVSLSAFLAALRAEGLYFDFTTALPLDILADALNVSLPDSELSSVRRVLLSPDSERDAMLFVEDGSGQHYTFSTAVSSPALTEFLSSRSGSNANFAFLLDSSYANLASCTLVLSTPAERSTLSVSNALSGNEDVFLRRAEFNPHTENRFTESSGTVIVREVSSTLYLRPDGTVDYQGTDAIPESLYFVSAASPDAPTLSEAATAAQRLMLTLLQDSLGDASLYLSNAIPSGNGFEITFDLMVDGTPIRFSNGSHAAVVTVEDQRITAFTLKARRYALTGDTPLVLPFAQAAAIARVWRGAELLVAYVDGGGETAAPAWIAE